MEDVELELKVNVNNGAKSHRQVEIHIKIAMDVAKKVGGEDKHSHGGRGQGGHRDSQRGKDRDLDVEVVEVNADKEVQ